MKYLGLIGEVFIGGIAAIAIMVAAITAVFYSDSNVTAAEARTARDGFHNFSKEIKEAARHGMDVIYPDYCSSDDAREYSKRGFCVTSILSEDVSDDLKDIGTRKMHYACRISWGKECRK